MTPPQGSKTIQGYELQLGTNNLAPFLFTQLLLLMLKDTAKTTPAGGVRAVWVSSSAVTRFSPKNGMMIDNLGNKKDEGTWYKYGVNKAGNVFHAAKFAKCYGSDGIISVLGSW
jgi:retinol dehydrogenase-12